MGARVVEHRSDDAAGLFQVPVVTAVHQCLARGGGDQPEDHAHRGGLAGPVGPGEADDRPRRHIERHVVDCRLGTVEPLGQRPAGDRDDL
jgi:hypothetical protein